VFCCTKNVLPVVAELVMPVWPKMVAPIRYLPSLRGTNAPTAHRHSSPMPRPSPRPAALREFVGRKSMPVLATKVRNL
jgi:hypothetical protein